MGGESTNQEYKLSIISGGIRIDLRDQSAQAGTYAFSLVNFSSLVGAWHRRDLRRRGGATAADGPHALR
ncbi:MAG: hypothetical protein R2708_12370 [Vicinamibacterales bacterium]